ncbi:MAG TPA: hypothetical protein VKM55_28190 [Candidatus Lokiarchaeia archaeon]|nr:hypothetical protein [Candidatus Lokiarchaeia archaeon]
MLTYSDRLELTWANGSIFTGPYYLVKSNSDYYWRFLYSNILPSETIIGKSSNISVKSTFSDDSANASWFLMNQTVDFVLENGSLVNENYGNYFLYENSTTQSSGSFDFNNPEVVSKTGRECYKQSTPQDITLTSLFINNSLTQGYVFNNSKDELNGRIIHDKTSAGFNLTLAKPISYDFWDFYNAEGLLVRGYNCYPFVLPSFTQIAFITELKNITIPPPANYSSTMITVVSISIAGGAVAVVGVVAIHRKSRATILGNIVQVEN